MRAQDSAAGKKARCPACGTVQTVPGAPPASDPLDNLAVDLTRGETTEPLGGRQYVPAPPPPPPPPPPPVSTLPPAAPIVQPPVVIVAPARRQSSSSAFVSGCFASLGYAFKNFGTILGMMLLIQVTGGIFGGFCRGMVALNNGKPPQFFVELLKTPGGIILVLLLPLMIALFLHGYMTRFFLNIVEGTVDGDDNPAMMPEFDFGSIIVTGLKAWALVLVYILPIITLPLLPIGLLALGYRNDGRAYNVFWALKFALRRPGELIMLWIAAICYTLVGILAVGLCGVVFASIMEAVRKSFSGAGLEVMQLAVQLLGGGLIAALQLTFMAVFSRCAGLLGRFNPQLMQSLDKTGSGASLLYVPASVLATIMMIVTVWVPLVMSIGRVRTVVALADAMFARSDPLAADSPARPSRRDVILNKLSADAIWPVAGSPLSAKSEDYVQRNLETIYEAIRRYAADHAGQFPSSLEELVGRYLPDRSILTCPYRNRSFEYAGGQTENSPPDNFLIYIRYLDEQVWGHMVGGTRFGRPPDLFQAELAWQKSTRRATASMPAPPLGGYWPADGPRLRFGVKMVVDDNVDLIFEAIGRYAKDHAGKFPSSLQELVGKYLWDSSILTCPYSGGSCQYVPGQSTRSDPDNILIYFPPIDNHVLGTKVSGTSINISPDDFRTLLAKQPNAPLLPANTIWPAAGSQSSSTAEAHIQRNMRTIHAALQQYARDHAGTFPPSLQELMGRYLPDSSTLTGRYLPDSSILTCPYTRNSFQYVPGQSDKSPQGNFLIYIHIDDETSPFGRELGITVGGISFNLPSEQLSERLARQNNNPVPPVAPVRPPTPPDMAARPPVVAPMPPAPTPTTRAVVSPPIARVTPSTLPASVPAPAPASGNVTLVVEGWIESKLPAEHPVRKACSVVKEMTDERGNLLIAGVGFGPPAKAKTDPGYIEYKNSMEEIFRTALKQDTRVFSVSQTKQTIGTVEYDRMIARQPGRIATACMTIQDGRCVSYWYVGTMDSWDAFTKLLGKATYKAD